MAAHQYPLDNSWNLAQERLRCLEETLDAWTIRNLMKLGVTTGWRCLEVAGGAGSIAEWLCNQVGPNGHVVATDLEPRFLERLPFRNLQVLRHNILEDELPQGDFDLVHTRGLLTFLPDSKKAVLNMASALKPGGWILIEEPDYISAIPDSSMPTRAIELSTKCWSVLLRHLKSRGYDTEFGRHLYHDLRSVDLADVHAEGFVPLQLGGTPSARFWRITLQQVQQDVLATGMITTKELEDYQTLLESPDYRWLWPMVVAAWGRRN